MRIADINRASVLPVVFIWMGSGCVQPEKVSTGPTFSADSGHTEPGDTVVSNLVSFDAWSALGPDSDPYPSHRTATHNCEESGLLAEEDVLEINTNDCDYAVIGQPIWADIEAGDLVELLMYHSALSSVDEPAEAHFSFHIGDRLFWERTIDIPWASEVYLIPIEVDWSAEAGTQVRVHLHNHGGNSWRVAYLKRTR
jgi:hypothetical protein